METRNRLAVFKRATRSASDNGHLESHRLVSAATLCSRRQQRQNLLEFWPEIPATGTRGACAAPSHLSTTFSSSTRRQPRQSWRKFCPETLATGTPGTCAASCGGRRAPLMTPRSRSGGAQPLAVSATSAAQSTSNSEDVSKLGMRVTTNCAVEKSSLVHQAILLIKDHRKSWCRACQSAAVF